MTLKQVIAGLIFSGCLMAAGEASTIPKGATANPDGTYTWTDKQGKTWTYLQTPFGLSRTPASAAPAKKAVPKGVPAGAKQNPDGTWAWTDKAGAKWKYVVTPFGASRYPVAAGEEAPAPTTASGVTIIDKGDTVRFERVTPFGTVVTEKKKSELTDQERLELERQSASADANKTKANQ